MDSNALLQVFLATLAADVENRQLPLNVLAKAINDHQKVVVEVLNDNCSRHRVDNVDDLVDPQRVKPIVFVDEFWQPRWIRQVLERERLKRAHRDVEGQKPKLDALNPASLLTGVSDENQRLGKVVGSVADVVEKITKFSVENPKSGRVGCGHEEGRGNEQRLYYIAHTFVMKKCRNDENE